ncbi:hypothetical protein AAW01_10920 [Aurantiacibacter gangjinensis]|uniref:Uncharacterized protein n=1 Tax=Aurantiacibacter gangjinensis TaxID=502682 RepID=A0A0G9MNX3_9SPHN|nr:hypothetical protein AAW01_10920 [Aurantiacibacter gangjinensis]
MTDTVSDKLAGAPGDVPGPSTNPATNLLLADIVIRVIGRITRQTVEKAMLGKRYGSAFAREAIDNKSIMHSLAAYGVTKFATKSVPGAMIVGSVAAGKLLFDRGRSRRAARKAGEAFLSKQADPDSMV